MNIPNYKETEYKLLKRLIVLFLIGVLLGALGANLLKNLYYGRLDLFDRNYLKNFSTITIRFPVLFQYVLWKRARQFFSFWIFMLTIIGIPFMVFADLYIGICAGFLISVSVMQYGFRGILIFLAYTMPQYLIYLPVMLMMAIQGYHLCRTLYGGLETAKAGHVKQIIEKVPIFFLLFILWIIGIALETYVGSRLLKYVMKYFLPV